MKGRRSSPALFRVPRLMGEVLPEELQKDVPVSGRRCMRTLMVKPAQVTVDEWRADGRQFVDPEIVAVQQPIHGACGNLREKLANRIRPLIARSASDEDGPRRAQCD